MEPSFIVKIDLLRTILYSLVARVAVQYLLRTTWKKVQKDIFEIDPIHSWMNKNSVPLYGLVRQTSHGEVGWRMLRETNNHLEHIIIIYFL